MISKLIVRAREDGGGILKKDQYTKLYPHINWLRALLRLRY